MSVFLLSSVAQEEIREGGAGRHLAASPSDWCAGKVGDHSARELMTIGYADDWLKPWLLSFGSRYYVN